MVSDFQLILGQSQELVAELLLDGMRTDLAYKSQWCVYLPLAV